MAARATSSRPSGNGGGFQARQPAHALQPGAGGDGALQPHAGRRRRGGDGRQRHPGLGGAYMGLVEVGVGLIPGGGGNMQLLRNVYGPYAGGQGLRPAALPQEGVPDHGTAKVATSAEEARELGFLNAQRRHHAQPGLPAHGCQGAGAGHGARGLPAAAADALPPAGAQRGGHHRHDAVRHAAQPPDLRARPEDRPEAGARAHRWRHLAVGAGDRGAPAGAGAGGVPQPDAARRRRRIGSCTCWRRASRCGTSARRLSKFPSDGR